MQIFNPIVIRIVWFSLFSNKEVNKMFLELHLELYKGLAI